MTQAMGDQLHMAKAALNAALGDAARCSCFVVDLQVDRSRFAAAFELNVDEHRRRQAIGAGAVTRTGLLHALWQLPVGIPFPASSLSVADVSTLREMGEGFVDGTSILTRTYEPAARVTAVVTVANGAGDALARASSLPAIFWRLAVSRRRPADMDRAIARGEAAGVGAIVMTADGPDVIVAPRAPKRGVPAVYRWWLGELAYRNWGGGNCAHCSS